MISVAVIEDHSDIREGLTTFLEKEDGFVCRLSVDSVEAFFNELDNIAPPQVLLLDIGLPGVNGLEGARLMREKHPEVEIIMLTVHNDPNHIFEALCAGASGYLLKSSSLSEIQMAVETVAKGGSWMSPEIARKVTEFFSKRPGLVKTFKASKNTSLLSETESKVLGALTDGLSYKLIADQFNISIDTVRSHIKNIYRKLQVNNKVDAATKYMRGEI